MQSILTQTSFPQSTQYGPRKKKRTFTSLFSINESNINVITEHTSGSGIWIWIKKLSVNWFVSALTDWFTKNHPRSALAKLRALRFLRLTRLVGVVRGGCGFGEERLKQDRTYRSDTCKQKLKWKHHSYFYYSNVVVPYDTLYEFSTRISPKKYFNIICVSWAHFW